MRTARDGPEALDASMSTRPASPSLDLEMPKSDGFAPSLKHDRDGDADRERRIFQAAL